MTMRCVAGRRPSLSGTARRKTGGRVMDCQSVACPPAHQTAPFHGHSPNSLQLFHQRHALVVDAPSSTGHDASAWRRHQCVTSPDYRISRQTASFTQSGRSTSLTQGCIVVAPMYGHLTHGFLGPQVWAVADPGIGLDLSPRPLLFSGIWGNCSKILPKNVRVALFGALS